jgi:CheY-like chemotaxis protein
MATRGAVLILEDEYLLATRLAEWVVAAGYSVVGPAGTTEKAQALITEQGIDTALLDVRLNDNDRSFELAARLQAMRIPFAFVTAYSRALFPPAFQRIPALPKPLSAQEVGEVLHRLLPPSEVRS